MASHRPKLSTKAKVITALIYILALALLVAVIYLNLNPSGKDPMDLLEDTLHQDKTVSTTVEVPYNAEGSDKYANIEPIYSISDITLREGADGSLTAYKDGVVADSYTGVAKKEEGVWYFVRDGKVDSNYNGIAANEKGNWYIADGKVDFTYTGTFQVNNDEYNIVGGKVVEE
ncbi:MAG: hypothetical protein IJ720_00965 [Clostridia bacterium]|nr:hypothetical protein [Clostridia bacterium]MBR1703917.1 hypothetical protein [Clostridia bacterium]